jgi:hypothetical protein
VALFFHRQVLKDGLKNMKFPIALILVAAFAVSALAQSQQGAPTLKIVTETPGLPSDLYYGNVKVKPLRLRPGTNKVITIDDSDFFVQQHYIDFLGRLPDSAGFNDWVSVLENCGPSKGFPGSPVTCDRTHVSSGFYRSKEFLDRGYFAYRFYDAVIGRLPLYKEFIPDMVRVGGSQTDAQSEVSKQQFVAEFMQRPEFVQKYGTPTAANAEAFVTALEQTAGITVANHAQLVAAMSNGTATPQQTLRAFIQTDEITAKFFYRGFVAMQYFGYLRRDPEPAGYNDWVDVLTFGRASAGVAKDDFRHLIQGFIYSIEYRNRF